MLGSFDYASGSNVDLLPSDVGDFSIPANLSVVKNGDEWTFTTTGDGGSVQADYTFGSTLDSGSVTTETVFMASLIASS